MNRRERIDTLVWLGTAAMILWALFAFAGSYAHGAELPPHAASKIELSRDGSGATFLETLTDGTTRKSFVPWPEMPTRVTLLATNDAGVAWRLDYLARYSDGTNVTCRTNSTFVMKPRKDREVPHVRPVAPPDPRTWRERAAQVASNHPDRAFAQIAARQAQMPATRTNRMDRTPRDIGKPRIAGDKIIHRMSDGTERTNQLRRAFTARVACAPVQQPVAPPDGSSTASDAVKVLAGAMAGAGAMAFIRRR